MSPKHRMITTMWCAITMIATMVVSHGHLIMREIVTHWPTEDTWEGRFENALYTQGGLIFVGSFVIGSVILIRGHFAKLSEENLARRELAQREQHERAAARRHEALMESLAKLAGDSPPKKSQPSGARPR